MVNPAGAPGSSLNLYPRANSALRATTAADLSGLDTFPDWNRDFNGAIRDATYRGAYRGEGTNPGWQLALDFKP